MEQEQGVWRMEGGPETGEMVIGKVLVNREADRGPCRSHAPL